LNTVKLGKTDQLWNSLLALNDSFKDINSNGHWNTQIDANSQLTFKEKDQRFVLKLHSTEGYPIYSKKIGDSITLEWSENISQQQVQFLSSYAPIILSRKTKLDSCFVFAHFAQSLDGKISTTKGHSKWIGNEENLAHSHRLRALADAIIIGGNTLQNDAPKLTVRMVKGENPQRIIISSSGHSICCMTEACSDKVIVLNKDLEEDNLSKENSVELAMQSDSDLISTEEIVKKLYGLGYKNIMIEGGAFTLSHFLNSKMLDYAQIHIAPIILGSGRNPFASEHEISTIDEALELRYPTLENVGDQAMYTGYLK